jgi:ribosome-binding protein aMBF1 (putative translation factor)
MKTHTSGKVQFIEQGGVPAFAVVPYADYLALVEDPEARIFVPDAVVELAMKHAFNMVLAWRLHKGLTQQELADRMGISQSALAQMERHDAKLQRRTLIKAAAALGVRSEQMLLDDDE